MPMMRAKMTPLPGNGGLQRARKLGTTRARQRDIAVTAEVVNLWHI